MTIPTLSTNCLHRSLGRCAFLVVSLALACFALPPMLQGDQICGPRAFVIGNTSLGCGALANTENPREGGGNNNTAIGQVAMYFNTSGSKNTATGAQALYNNTAGNDNTAIGSEALRGTAGNGNTSVGAAALWQQTSGNYNTALGFAAGADIRTGSYNLYIDNRGNPGDQRTIRIGDENHMRTFIAGISGVGVTGAAVVVNAAGQLGVAPSSQRFKNEIKPIGKASEAILALKPVTFRYKKEIDAAGTSQFGLVAEDVEKVNPALIMRDKEGKPYSVRYDQVNAMLLNEFL